MPSKALTDMLQALSEIDDLPSVNTTSKGRGFKKFKLSRVIGRASVVLLSSHFEEYIRSVNEEATDYVNSRGVVGSTFRENLRLRHSKPAVDELGGTSWEHRSDKLKGFVETDSWLWEDSKSGRLDHRRILLWMRSPTPNALMRFYKYWEIDDVFNAITKKPHTRRDLWLRIEGLVDKRNNIAHGDQSIGATPQEVRQYKAAVTRFCSRADARLSSALRKLVGGPSRPW